MPTKISRREFWNGDPERLPDATLREASKIVPQDGGKIGRIESCVLRLLNK
jgi:hypothetical protein